MEFSILIHFYVHGELGVLFETKHSFHKSKTLHNILPLLAPTFLKIFFFQICNKRKFGYVDMDL